MLLVTAFAKPTFKTCQFTQICNSKISGKKKRPSEIKINPKKAKTICQKWQGRSRKIKVLNITFLFNPR
jgi:hypothetical protein